ncbi:alpha/beta hydrolase [Cellulosilyticum sp. I15G10I2]|uniref:alpha/beta hydrolase n=1 Tax=Cellulosilyticum sp. I15G10I2 TaxID=1892843 RepID=UPI00085BF6A9|nr:alpha/beta hydrolase [Cellulosilyticum sp. I15G10I2]
MHNFKVEEHLSRMGLILKLFSHDLIQEKVIHHKDIKYGKNKRQYYRLYQGNNSKLPLIFFVHGGGWWHGSPKLVRAVGKFFYKQGYTVVLPAYRLVPRYTYPKQAEDVICAFSHVMKTFMDKDYNHQVVVIGFSAGGELGAHLVFDAKMHHKYGISDQVFKCFISLAGVLDFAKCKSSYAKHLIKNYVGKKYNKDVVNPKGLIRKEVRTPVMCMHGSKDKLIDIQNAISFSEAVNRHGGTAKVQMLKGYNHSDMMGLIVGKGRKETHILLDFIKQ